MKKFFFIAGMSFISCCSSKKATGPVSGKNSHDHIPVCINDLIVRFENEEKQNPPRSIYQYTYKGKTVYYVPAICCDFFSDLYDDQCNVIGHPDGGFAGRGDGKTTDFADTRINEKLIWKDERK